VVRLIDQEGAQLGTFPLAQALRTAEASDLDLVEVSPDADPPVCRIVDYGKLQYEQKKRRKENRQKRTTVKEIKMRPKIGDHDFETKIRRAQEFLNQGHQVKVVLQFRGREASHPEIGMRLLERFKSSLSCSVDQNPLRQGRSILMKLSPPS